MHSFGLGDIRIAAYRWMFDPEKYHRGNIQLGAGIKLPTGDYNYKDYWYNVGPAGAKELRPVDQSIQLGDGGTGITLETNTFYNFTKSVGVYGNFYYLSQSHESRMVPAPTAKHCTPALANEAISSVPDQYMARAGVNYSSSHLPGLTFGAGTRIEGIPVHDVIGGSNDFRRPGYIISAEPSVNYSHHNYSLFAAVPIAMVRNRMQSITDKENSVKRGTFVRGDAAFADYTINVGAAFRF